MPYIVGVKHRAEETEWSPIDHMTYDEPQDAARWVKSENQYMKSCGMARRYTVLPLLLEDPLAWRYREKQKLVDETHVAPPWGIECTRVQSDLFEHVDPNDGTKIRFFASSRDAQRGKYTSMAVGRFLRGYSSFNQDEIEKFCASLGMDLTVSELKFAYTADDFERVYTNGPHSCMAYKIDDEEKHYLTDIHPVRVYGDLDLAVAYIERGGEITARSLVWPEKKIYGRIYGDSNRLITRLEEAGYTEAPNWDFSGARLHRIEVTVPNEWEPSKPTVYTVAPYVDGENMSGCYEGDYIVLTNTPTVILKSPDGVIETDKCASCGAKGVHLDWSDDNDWYECAEGCD